MEQKCVSSVANLNEAEKVLIAEWVHLNPEWVYFVLTGLSWFLKLTVPLIGGLSQSGPYPLFLGRGNKGE